jgi:hypothetical protein
MNEENQPSGADALPKDSIIRVPMKAFEYSAEYQFLDNAEANECETASELSVDQAAVIDSAATKAVAVKRRKGKEQQQQGEKK